MQYKEVLNITEIHTLCIQDTYIRTHIPNEQMQNPGANTAF